MSKAKQHFNLNEAASLRRMVALARKYGGALALRCEDGALEKARSCLRFAKELREANA